MHGQIFPDHPYISSGRMVYVIMYLLFVIM